MNENPKRWIDKWVKNQNLPALQRTAADLDTLSCSDDPFEHLPDIIHRDPGATCHVFTSANSVQHQHFSMPVTTVEHAAMMLGLDRMRAIADALPVLDPATTGENGKGLLSVYSRAYHAATQASAWARLRADMVPWEVFAATLLLDLGEMAAWSFQPEKAGEVDDLTHGTGVQSRESAQLHVFGFTYRALSAELASFWKLPLLVHDALDHENSGKPRIKVILLANAIARAAEQNWYSDTMIAHIDEGAGLLHISYTEMVNVIHQAALSAAREWQAFGIVPAAAGLTVTPPPRVDRRLAPPVCGKKPHIESAEAAGKEQQRAVEPQLAAQPEILEQTICWLSEEHDPPPTLPAIVKQAVQGLHKGLGLYRVVFAICTPDKRSLKARVVRSSEKSAEFSHFHMDLAPPHLFTRLMEKPASIWINDDNRAKYKELLPASLLDSLDVDSFFASSMFIDGRPVGMFYCDCHRDSSNLNEACYSEFQHVCEFVATAMERFDRQSRKPCQKQ